MFHYLGSMCISDDTVRKRLCSWGSLQHSAMISTVTSLSFNFLVYKMGSHLCIIYRDAGRIKQNNEYKVLSTRHISSVQSLSRVRLFATPWIAAGHASLSINQPPEFTQTNVHRVSDAIQPSHPLSSSSPPVPNPSQHQSLFQWVDSSHETYWVEIAKSHVWKDFHTGIISTVHLLSQIQFICSKLKNRDRRRKIINNLNTVDN